MASELDDIATPYNYGRGEAPGSAPAPAAPIQTATPPSTPAASISHPELDNIPVPYNSGEQPGGTPTAAPTVQGPGLMGRIGKFSNWLIGADQPPVVLQPRSLSQVGSDITNYGRVAGNQAFVPGSLDVGLAALHGTDVATENAKTKQAESDLGPAASAIARFQGQRLSANRILGEAGVPYANNPIAQGIVTGGGGTLLHGGSLTDAAANTAVDTGLSTLGQVAGTTGSALAKKAFDRVSEASTPAIDELQNLYKEGGDIAGAAENYAATARGAAKDAYQKVAAAANRSIDSTSLQRAAAAGIGTYVPGVGPLISAYVADPTIKAYNQFSKNVDVSHALDQLYPTITGDVRSAVNPQNWRDALQSFAVSQGPNSSAALDAFRTFSPTSWTSWLWNR